MTENQKKIFAILAGFAGLGGLAYFAYRRKKQEDSVQNYVPPAWAELVFSPEAPTARPAPAASPSPESRPAASRAMPPSVGTAAAPAVATATSTAKPAGKADVWSLVKERAPAFGLDPKVVYGIMWAESMGNWMDPKTGKIIIRFEPHVFARLTAEKALNKKSRATKEETEKYGAKVLNPGMAHINDGRRRTGGQAAEWETLARAQAIDPERAVMATSFGLGQIMGANYAPAGFKTAQEMLASFTSGAEGQVMGMLRFITSDPKMTKAINEQNWPAFVAIYNRAPVGTPNNTSYVKRVQDEMAKRA
jgi:hypothetical protein